MRLGHRGLLALAAGLALAPNTAIAQSGKPAAAPPVAPAPATAPPAPAASPAPAPVAPPGSALPAAPSPVATGTAYNVRLHDLERRVNELKEQIFRSKARLNLLKETVLHQVLGSSDALIAHKNEMGSTYNLIKLVYALDGAEIYAKVDDTGHLGDAKEFEIFSGAIVPGNHTLTVMMIYQGNGYGVFSYIKGYKFTVKGSHTFTAAEGKQTQLKVVGFEKGNPITTDPKDRPAIDFRMSVVARKSSQPNAAAGAPDSGAPAPASTPAPGGGEEFK